MSTSIEWTDETDNIIVVESGGWWCRKLSPECANCYAEELNDKDFFRGNHLRYIGKAPTLRLRRDLIEKWARQRVARKHFVASMTDVFGDWVERSWQFEMLDGMLAAPLQTFQILTKRAGVMLKAVKLWMAARGITKPPSNIWLGFTAGDQKRFDERWQHMKALAAMGWTIFVSCEPLLGPINLPADFLALGSRAQVIVGGESGKKARPLHPDWVRALRWQCFVNGVAFFFKQWGEWSPVKPQQNGADFIPADRWGILLVDGRFFLGGKGVSLTDLIHPEREQNSVYRVGKVEAGRVLDGRTWEEFPLTNG